MALIWLETAGENKLGPKALREDTSAVETASNSVCTKQRRSP